jgi:peptidoglycan/xylan/chitin deacetylase (PgdA/CDA1 family)
VTRFAARAAAAAFALGLHHLARWRYRRQLLVVCYHGITDRPVPPDLPTWHHLPVSEFERQLDYLRRHYRVLPIDEAVTQLRRGAIAQPTASITFDDGYRNNFSVALPVLQRVKLPATVYLVTDFIGTDQRLWTVRLEAAIRRTARSTLDLSCVGMSPGTELSKTDRTALARNVIDRLKELDPLRRDTAVASILEQSESAFPDDGGCFEFLSWDDVARMEATGLISFGAHTARHEIVSRLPDARLDAEIGGSVTVTRTRVHNASATFAFPNGRAIDFDARAKRVLQEHGLAAALTTICGLNDAETDRYELRRITVGSDMSFARFCVLSSGLVPGCRGSGARQAVAGAAAQPMMEVAARRVAGT